MRLPSTPVTTRWLSSNDKGNRPLSAVCWVKTRSWCDSSGGGIEREGMPGLPEVTERQLLYHLRQLRKFRVSPRILQCFYAAAVESILSGNITISFGNCSAKDKKALQRVVRSAKRTMGTSLTPLQELYNRRCNSTANKIMGDPFHPCNGLFQLLRSGKRLRCHAVRTERLRRSFFPEAIRTVNAYLTRD